MCVHLLLCYCFDAVIVSSAVVIVATAVIVVSAVVIVAAAVLCETSERLSYHSYQCETKVHPIEI